MSREMIIAQFDSVYLRWGKLFLQSLVQSGYQGKVLFDCINLKKEHIEALQDIYSNLIVQNSWTFLPRGKTRKAMMANRKAKVLKQAILQHHADVFVLMDVDLLIRASLDPLFQIMENADAAMIFRPHEWGDHAKLNSSIIMVKKEAMPLIDRWLLIMKRERKIYTFPEAKVTLWEKLWHGKRPPPNKRLRIRKNKWFWDQITLFKATEEVPLKYANIPQKLYLAEHVEPDAAIWSANFLKKDEAFHLFAQELQSQIAHPS